jgi:RNA polymerase sigma-70 factor (ECF subfamily)
MAKPITDESAKALRALWFDFMDEIEPLRPKLHAYCLKLSGSVWEAEDLVQESLLRAFAVMGRGDLHGEHSRFEKPHAYLCQIATNLWIDRLRRQTREADAQRDDRSASAPDALITPAAGAALFQRVSPQERAAVVLKDVCDLSLAEIAKMLSTSVGAVKAALHRGRGRLKDEAAPRRRAAPAALVDAFMQRLDACDFEGLLALMLETGSIEMPGALLEVGREQFQRKGSWLWQAVNVHPELPAELRPPKWANQRVDFDGEPIILGFMPTPDGRLLQGITRFEEADGKIARVRSYCFSPEMTAEVAEALGLAVGWIPYRFPTPAPGGELGGGQLRR